MTTEWFYARSGTKHGPFSDEQIRQHAANGTLQATDMIWCTGMTAWEPASQKLSFPPPIPSSGPPPLPADQPTATSSSSVTLRGLAGRAASFLGASAAKVMWQAKLVAFKGRWCSAANPSEWIEYLPSDVFLTSEGMTGKWAALEDGKYLERTPTGGQTERYRIVQLDISSDFLQLQAADGSLFDYTKGQTVTEERQLSEAKESLSQMVGMFTHVRCPSCGQRSGEKSGPPTSTDTRGTIPAFKDLADSVWKLGTTRQKIYQWGVILSKDHSIQDCSYGQVEAVISTTRTHYRCTKCSHAWDVDTVTEKLLPDTFTEV